jgi:hypothetical protein
MCTNAMTYNQSETVYYRAAKRLMHGGLKILTREKIKSLASSLPYLAEITSAELGFELHTPEEVIYFNYIETLALNLLPTLQTLGMVFPQTLLPELASPLSYP